MLGFHERLPHPLNGLWNGRHGDEPFPSVLNDRKRDAAQRDAELLLGRGQVE